MATKSHKALLTQPDSDASGIRGISALVVRETQHSVFPRITDDMRHFIEFHEPTSAFSFRKAKLQDMTILVPPADMQGLTGVTIIFFASCCCHKPSA